MGDADALRCATLVEEAQGDAGSSLSSVDDHGDNFEALLKEFQQSFETKQDSMELVTAKVVQICNTALGAAGIRHTAISSRMKTWKSAEGSIRRKRDERALRQKLRSAVESQNQGWLTYCSTSNLESTKTRPFISGREMFMNLRDFGGVRISLYFPGDVDRISNIFMKIFKIRTKTRKHQSVDVTMDLQRRIEKLDSSTSSDRPHASNSDRSFSGYKATHFCVRLLDEDIPPNKISVWKDLTVEIQVGTLVMHAWSEIEHDMIYKPLESQTISNDEVRLLDLINGIVATGESALRQLEASMDRRRRQRAQDGAAFAVSHHELGSWLDKYCLRAKDVVIEGDWQYLIQLYGIMKATGDHRLETIQQILEKTEPIGFVDRRTLPIKMLKVICEPVAELEEPRYRGTPHQKVIAGARYWARQFIYSLNMAMFLGVAEAFLDVMLMSARPRLADILDIIHPTSPSHGDNDTLLAITSYCESILNHHGSQLHDEQDIHERKTNMHNSSQELQKLACKQLLPIAACLSRADRVVISSELGGGIFVPMSIVGLFITAGSHERRASSFQHELSFIEHYVNNRKADNYDKLAMWDRLKNAVSGNSDGNMEDCYLVPNLAGAGGEAKWKFVARPLSLDVARPAGGKTSPDVSFSRSIGKGEDEIQELAYRLHPDQRQLVDAAWTLMLHTRPSNFGGASPIEISSYAERTRSAVT
ncbi:hypothetical protein E8E14_006348 [Neopestalotiopsis sp. 37M]|nr:hypothetical protein E8E14_006348 [Neopestalotiopsis sp. 37M]